MRIKEVIKEKGTSVKEVAQKMGIKPPSLSRTINGNTTVEMLQRIAKVLDVSVSELIEEKGGAICPHCGKSIRLK